MPGHKPSRRQLRHQLRHPGAKRGTPVSRPNRLMLGAPVSARSPRCRRDHPRCRAAFLLNPDLASMIAAGGCDLCGDLFACGTTDGDRLVRYQGAGRGPWASLPGAGAARPERMGARRAAGFEAFRRVVALPRNTSVRFSRSVIGRLTGGGAAVLALPFLARSRGEIHELSERRRWGGADGGLSVIRPGRVCVLCGGWHP
jgi:hypothetical protein